MTGPILCIPENVLSLLVEARDADHEVRQLIGGNRSLGDLLISLSDADAAALGRALGQRDRLLESVGRKLRSINRTTIKTIEQRMRDARSRSRLV